MLKRLAIMMVCVTLLAVVGCKKEASCCGTCSKDKAAGVEKACCGTCGGDKAGAEAEKKACPADCSKPCCKK